MSTRKFIIVSNRLPITVRKEDGVLKFSESSGGLATAMSSLEVSDTVWIGWPGIDPKELTPVEKRMVTRTLRKKNCYPVYLPQELIELFYEGYANDTLWPLFHYFQQSAQYDETYWQAYKTAHKLFKKAVQRCAHSHATIWIHDYHFLLLPAMLRQKMPHTTIGLFLHIPFPSYEIFRLLPERSEILRGMLGADLIGFHIYDYARHFLSSCLRMLGVESSYGMIDYQGRTILADAFPIGIDYQKFQETLKQPETQAEMQTITETHQGRKIILSVDRLDYTKGIKQRLQAYDLFLKENLSQHKKVSLLMVAVPSRTAVQTYQELRDDVEQLVSRINGTYGTVDWNPVSYQFKNLPFQQVVALYACADIALVTPLRDGMNLVAKEYIASKPYGDGVLILSELAGAIDELPEAIRVNPNDRQSIKNGIQEALAMSQKEKRQKLRAMRKRIATYTVQRWAADFIEQLSAVKDHQHSQQKKILRADTFSEIKEAYTKADKRLLIFDYDGTLRGFVSSPDPNKAKPSIALKRLLSSLAHTPNTKVCIISGRTRSALEGWFRNDPVMLVAEHGAAYKFGTAEWAHAQSSFSHHKPELLAVLRQYANRTAGAEIEEKDHALVWHYRNVPTELAYVRNVNVWRDLQAVVAGTDIKVYAGNKVIEIKPEQINKGVVAARLLKEYPADFVLCAGDDYTDEDMFTTLPKRAVTIKVGLGNTDAQYQVQDIATLLALARHLIA